MNHAVSSGRRVRRPKDRAELIERLLQPDSPFSTMRDVLLFAAAVGWWKGNRVPFEVSDEPIHWHTMTARPTAEPFINMLALHSAEDVMVLGDDQFEARAQVFEEYANGGLIVLATLIEDSPKSVTEVVRELVLQAAGTGLQDTGRVDVAKVFFEL